MRTSRGFGKRKSEYLCTAKQENRAGVPGKNLQHNGEYGPWRKRATARLFATGKGGQQRRKPMNRNSKLLSIFAAAFAFALVFAMAGCAQQASSSAASSSASASSAAVSAS